MTSVTKTNLDASTTRVDSIYDGLSRRIEKKTFQNNVITQTTRYVYDGLLPVMEINWSGDAIGAGTETTYTRGLDLSGTFDGAGGIGGLLAFNPTANQPNSPSTLFLSDRMGNVTTLVDGNDSILAKYEYTAFGSLLSATGPLANVNRYQFSSKENDFEVGLTYYLFRFYDPSFGRWINRDPIGEAGGVNVYEFCFNDLIGWFDDFGKAPKNPKNSTNKNNWKNFKKFLKNTEDNRQGNTNENPDPGDPKPDSPNTPGMRFLNNLNNLLNFWLNQDNDALDQLLKDVSCEKLGKMAKLPPCPYCCVTKVRYFPSLGKWRPDITNVEVYSGKCKNKEYLGAPGVDFYETQY